MTETRGEHLKQRRLGHGMSVNQLHQAAKVSRDAIVAAEAGAATELTYSKLEAWFAAFEEETGGGKEPAASGSPHIITIRGTRAGDIDVVVSGPVEDIEQLTATVERLLRSGERTPDED